MPAHNKGEYASVTRAMTGSMLGSAWASNAICSGRQSVYLFRLT